MKHAEGADDLIRVAERLAMVVVAHLLTHDELWHLCEQATARSSI
jgi:hypothetical protein